ncbi:hypothetical protein SADUNF_Sadunf12G0080000 [Salix dunnii]|uniref:Uncharacterized protein n=1 Tax=Salix dunnii TaxID=1413687 RepID=A0A835JK56_9ROSI|nr:hypothetical protein SADUNF_Sadunf12G0080000 [Salix dunnii]
MNLLRMDDSSTSKLYVEEMLYRSFCFDPEKLSQFKGKKTMEDPVLAQLLKLSQPSCGELDARHQGLVQEASC